MKILVVGGGGREHALAWRLSQSTGPAELVVTPGNPGMERVARLEPQLESADLAVIGPEAPLVDGLADRLRSQGARVIGPSAAAATLEGSKAFAKELMDEASIPTARFQIVESPSEARRALARFDCPVVLKADGLAAGKGVVIAKDRDSAERTLDQMLSGELVGDAGRRVVIEDFCPGEEVSFIGLSDGETILPFAPTQDHKQVFDNDQGPNTGGMGTYCDDRILEEETRSRVMNQVMRPAVDAMARRGTPFQGFLFAGLMMTPAGIRVLEFNVRLGDPETQVLMHRLESDLIDVFQAAAEGQLAQVRLRWKPDPSVCVVLCAKNYPGEPQRGDEIFGLEAAESTGATVFHAGTARRDGRLVTNGGRVLGVTASGKTLKDAIANVYAAVDRIKFNGMHYRRDIGAKGLKRW